MEEVEEAWLAGGGKGEENPPTSRSDSLVVVGAGRRGEGDEQVIFDSFVMVDGGRDGVVEVEGVRVEDEGDEQVKMTRSLW